MNNEKLEDRKVVSTVSFVLCLIFTIMFIFGDIDSVKDGGKPVIFLSLISGIATVISFVIAVVTSFTLKKRQGKEYFSTKMYIESFIEVMFPSLMASYSSKLRKLNISEKNKNTRLWKELCVGYDKERIITFVLWFLLLAACIWGIADNIIQNGDNKYLDVAGFSFAAFIIVIILICVVSGIKKDPIPIFEYMDIKKEKFNTLAKHYENSNKITHRIWSDEEYVFAQAKGKAYCFLVEEYEEMTIHFNWNFRFTMVLASKYDCIVQSSFSPFGFRRLKRLLESEDKNQDNA